MTELTQRRASVWITERLRDSMRNSSDRIWKVKVWCMWGGQIEAKVVLRRKRERPPAALMNAVLLDMLDLFAPTAINCSCGRRAVDGRVFACVRMSPPDGGWKFHNGREIPGDD